MSPVILSPDRKQYWDGEQGRPVGLLSPDERMIWTGSAWLPVAAGEAGPAPAGASQRHALSLAYGICGGASLVLLLLSGIGGRLFEIVAAFPVLLLHNVYASLEQRELVLTNPLPRYVRRRRQQPAGAGQAMAPGAGPPPSPPAHFPGATAAAATAARAPADPLPPTSSTHEWAVQAATFGGLLATFDNTVLVLLGLVSPAFGLLALPAAVVAGFGLRLRGKGKALARLATMSYVAALFNSVVVAIFFHKGVPTVVAAVAVGGTILLGLSTLGYGLANLSAAGRRSDRA